MSSEREHELDQWLSELGFASEVGERIWLQYREILGWVLDHAKGRKRFSSANYQSLLKTHPKLERPSRKRQISRLLSRLQRLGWQCDIPPEAVKPRRDLLIPPSAAVAERCHQVNRLEHLVRRQWSVHTRDPDSALFMAALLLVTRCGASDQVACGILARLRVCDVDDLPGIKGRIRTPIHGAASHGVYYEFITPRPLRDLLCQQTRRMRRHGAETPLFRDAFGGAAGHAQGDDARIRRSLSRYLRELKKTPEVEEHGITLPTNWTRLAQAGRYLAWQHGVPPAIVAILQTYPLPKSPVGIELFNGATKEIGNPLIPDTNSSIHLSLQQADKVREPTGTNPTPVSPRDDDWSAFARIALADFLAQIEKRCVSRKGTVRPSSGKTLDSILSRSLGQANAREPSTRSVLHLALHWLRRKLHADGIKVSSARKYVGQLFPELIFDHPESRDIATWDMETVDELTTELMTRPSWSIKTQNDFIVSWMQFLRFCHDVGILDRGDLPSLTLDESIAGQPGRRTIITPWQFDHLIHHIHFDATLSAQERESYKAVLTLGFYGGLRASEVLNLTLGDLVISKPTTHAVTGEFYSHVLRTKTPAGRRTIPLHRLLPEEARRTLHAWCNERQASAIATGADRNRRLVPLFGPLEEGRRPVWNEVIQGPMQYMRRVLQTDIDFHGLRHSAASWLLLRAYLLIEPELGPRLAQGTHPLLDPAENKTLDEMFSAFEPKASNAQEKILIFLAKFLGHANIRTLMLTYAHTLGPIHSQALDHASTWHQRTDRIRVPA